MIDRGSAKAQAQASYVAGQAEAEASYVQSMLRLVTCKTLAPLASALIGPELPSLPLGQYATRAARACTPVSSSPAREQPRCIDDECCVECWIPLSTPRRSSCSQGLASRAHREH